MGIRLARRCGALPGLQQGSRRFPGLTCRYRCISICICLATALVFPLSTSRGPAKQSSVPALHNNEDSHFSQGGSSHTDAAWYLFLKCVCVNNVFYLEIQSSEAARACGAACTAEVWVGAALLCLAGGSVRPGGLRAPGGTGSNAGAAPLARDSGFCTLWFTAW